MVVLLALVLRLKWAPETEVLPPPATVSMVFDGGRPQGPTTETPTPGPPISGIPPATPGGPSGEGPPPAAESPETPATPPPTIQASRTAPEAPPQPPESPTPRPEEPTPRPEAAAPPAAAFVPSAPPPPPPEPPSTPAPAEVIVPPPAPVAPPVPVPSVPEPVPLSPAPQPASPALPAAKPETQPPAPRPPAAKPDTQAPIRQAVPAHSDFPAPMEFSLNRPPAPPGMAAPVKPVLSLELPKQGKNDPTPFSIDTDADVGPDWRNALSAWVAEHSYYPAQAVELGEQGTVKVLVVMLPDGLVVSVDLERRSGSPWLDLALQGLFRGAKLPAMPKAVGDEPVPFHFTMHYILMH